MNIYLRQAAEFMGVQVGNSLSKTDFKRLRAKAKKMKISEKKASRRQNTITL